MPRLIGIKLFHFYRSLKYSRVVELRRAITMNFLEESMEETLNQPKDEEILILSLEKPAYFKILIDRYQKAFLRKALGILRQQEEAEDIVQETFVKIYFNAKKFKKVKGIEFKSWAYKILVNTAISRYRKISKKWQAESTNPLDLELASERNLSTEDIVLESETKSLASELLSRLPEQLSRLLSKYYIEDKPYKDIAKEESITIPALKMKLFRAKKILKNLTKNDENEHKI